MEKRNSYQKVATWNINGIGLSGFKDVVAGIIYQNIDISFITETRMNYKHYPRSLHGYNIHAREAPSKRKWEWI